MKASERLYLSKKEGQEIYIDIFNLPQHQIDGIRFIYKHFKKKNKGVILNDPPGYGKAVQVVLFLDAIRSFLSQSALILCKETKVNSWIRHFQKWTTFNEDEILVESFNPNRNKMLICVNSMKNIAQFAKRTWSVVIVDDDNDNTWEILKTKYKCNFKICITSQDMKENLKMLSQIHTWLDPDDSFNVNDFISNKTNVRDVITKSILLDACMQDFVLRRNCLETSLNVEKTSTVFQSKLSRKNKDITGTTIKRSKKSSNKGTDELKKKEPPNPVKTLEIDTSILNETKNAEVAVIDVESFVDKVNPIVSKALEDSQHTAVVENNKQNVSFAVEYDTSIDNKSNTRTLELNPVHILEIDSSIFRETKNAVVTKMDVESFVNEVNPIASEALKYPQHTADVESNKQNEPSAVEIDTSMDNISNTITEELDSSNNSTICTKIDANGLNRSTNNAINIANGIQCKSNNELNVTDIEKQNNTDEGNNSKVSELVETEGNTGHKTIDAIMKEMEEKTMKKFKGSFLDSII